MYHLTILRICKFFVDLTRILVPMLTILVKILLWILAAAAVLLLIMLLF